MTKRKLCKLKIKIPGILIPLNEAGHLDSARKTPVLLRNVFLKTIQRLPVKSAVATAVCTPLWKVWVKGLSLSLSKPTKKQSSSRCWFRFQSLFSIYSSYILNFLLRIIQSLILKFQLRQFLSLNSHIEAIHFYIPEEIIPLKKNKA